MLRVLADVALGECQRKHRPANPMCIAHGKARQRQSCFRCIQEDMAIVNSVPYLTRWDAACILNCMARSYVCGLCFLTETDARNIRKATDCRLHSVYNGQRRCAGHNLRWTECRRCLYDVRAGTSFCQFCGLRFSAQCACPRGPLAMRAAVLALDAPQPAEQVELKERLAASALEYAARLQSARDDPDAIAAIMAARVLPDCRGLQNVFF